MVISMGDWLGNRSAERYAYRRVSWPSMQEVGEYANVTSGSVEYGLYTSMKATASFDFIGGEAPGERDLVRIYYSFTDGRGERVESVIGTFFVEGADVTIESDSRRGGTVTSGSVSCSSVLKAADEVIIGVPLTVAAGTQSVARAAALLESVGISVIVADESAHALAGPHTFDPDETVLGAANWLLDAAGFSSAGVDAMGHAVLSRYVAPTERATSWTWRDDGRSVVCNGIGHESDWRDAPNVVRAIYEDDAETLWATARNVSGGRASLDARGREKTELLSVSELEGSTRSARVSALKAQARARLVDMSAEVEYATVKGATVPVSTGDTATVDFSGWSFSGTVSSVSIDLSAGTQAVYKLRRFTSASSAGITVEGGAY